MGKTARQRDELNINARVGRVSSLFLSCSMVTSCSPISTVYWLTCVGWQHSCSFSAWIVIDPWRLSNMSSYAWMKADYSSSEIFFFCIAKLLFSASSKSRTEVATKKEKRKHKAEDNEHCLRSGKLHENVQEERLQEKLHSCRNASRLFPRQEREECHKWQATSFLDNIPL